MEIAFLVFPLNGLLLVLLRDPPRSVPACPLAIIRPQPTKFVKEFAQKLFKNILQVAFGQTIARYPPLCRISEACSTVGPGFDPQVGLEVITNQPQNPSISLGLARKRVLVFVASCNPSCDPFLILCHFFFSQLSSCSSSDVLTTLPSSD